jgi:hypothetical protein
MFAAVPTPGSRPSPSEPNTIVGLDPKSEKFQTWVIPGGGDIVRNMSVTPDGKPVHANSLTNEVGLSLQSTEREPIVPAHPRVS